jgi:hypothetical protein
MFIGRPGPNVAQQFPNVWAQSPVQFWPSQRGGSIQDRSDGDTPSQPVGSSAVQQTITGPTMLPSLYSPTRLEPAPSLGIPSNFSPGPGSAATAPANGQSGTTEPEPAGPIWFDSQAAGNAAGVGKEAGQESGGVTNGPSGPAMASPPAQLFALLDADSATTRLVSQGEASVGSDPLAGNGPARRVRIASGHPGGAITSRGALVSTAYVLTDLTDGSRSDEWPRPKSADLIASALPFDRAALDRAIDVFFQQFDDMSRGDLAGQTLADTVLYSVALACAFAALDVIRRRMRFTTTGRCVRVCHPNATADHIGFPELPGSWSSRPS